MVPLLFVQKFFIFCYRNICLKRIYYKYQKTQRMISMTLYEFYEKYFLVNLNDYPNIGIDLEISKILFCLLVGLIIATVIIGYRRFAMITIIKKLMRHEIYSESDAKTLTELNIDSFGTRLSLKGKGRLSGIVKRAGEKEYTYEEYSALIKSKDFKEEKIDFSEAKFYLNKDNLIEAQKVLDVPTPSIINTSLFCVFLIAVYICIILIIPEILSLINNLI